MQRKEQSEKLQIHFENELVAGSIAIVCGLTLRRCGELLELQGESGERPGAVRPRQRGRRRRLASLVGRHGCRRGAGRVGGFSCLGRGGY